MRGINKVILIGNLGADPEMRYLPSGIPVATFKIATNETWTNKDGTKVEKTEWHRVVAFRKLAEICGEYLNKGKQVYIEGRLQTRQWEGKDGNKRWTTEIVADTMQMLGGGGAGKPQSASAEKSSALGGEEAAPMETPPPSPQADETDDIPF